MLRKVGVPLSEYHCWCLQENVTVASTRGRWECLRHFHTAKLFFWQHPSCEVTAGLAIFWHVINMPKNSANIKRARWWHFCARVGGHLFNVFFFYVFMQTPFLPSWTRTCSWEDLKDRSYSLIAIFFLWFWRRVCRQKWSQVTEVVTGAEPTSCGWKFESYMWR